MSEAYLKPEKDYSKDADKIIPEAQELAKTNVQAAIDKLAVLEKQARQASDLATTSRVLVTIVTICKEAGDWNLLNDQVQVLSKKHAQLKQATTKMVQTVMGFLDETPNLETKLSVIDTLRTVTEGKIFVEVERARVTRILSDIKKSQGDLNAAADILCELQVETFGSMTRREKTDFILEQVGLCLERGDYTQAAILSRKINKRYFARKPKKTEELEKERKELEEREKTRAADEPPPEKDEDVTDLKLRYYYQQIQLANHDHNYLEVCKHYRDVLDTESIEQDPEKLPAVLARIVYYVVLAPYDNEQHDLLHRIQQDKRLSLVPVEARLLKLFTVHELMRWYEIVENFGPQLCSTDIFDAELDPANPDAYQRWQDLRKRVIEHNVRVVAKYYTRIEFGRLTQLLDLDEDETERYVSDLVTSKTIYAKIDRPARIVNFSKPRDADDVLNEWSSNMRSLLGLLERIDHLITKEEMMARIMPKKGKA
ncbi:hypothetical protein VTN31DRAFT_7542 [Thermomyces dupontii]|uniref:uncharacterized protein n=1 Tax=Talaromyces thermophilus TaxID=28565 RepID=UPI003744ACF3